MQHALTRLLVLIALCSLGSPAMGSLKALAPRRVIALDGVWQVEQGSAEARPVAFTHTVRVPGLVDLAKPAFTEVGKKSAQREAFWYRRTFQLEGGLSEVALLKIHKARYGTKVWLNGQVVGEHWPCFTPAYLDVKSQLKAGENELVIRLGAHRESLPLDMPGGWDFEKYLFIPGIYDSVEIILANAPYIQNVQTVPDLEAKAVRVVAEIVAGESATEAAVQAQVTKAGTSKVVGTGGARTALGAREMKKLDFTVPMADCRLWSPEDPFLYELKLSTAGDAAKTRFGMRTFRFDPQSKRALLNGKPYYLRGSNITLYRFFEDAARGELPWQSEWVRKLHRQIKVMNWNALRYCIGFPPEFWYEIADEEGVLIQDEFPIWLLGKAPENPTAERIIPEYTAWMRERWNHPSVVIWDAQNESHTAETGKAREAVRLLDLSNRPWENGWAEPGAATDFVESHPYLFSRGWSGKEPFRLKEMPTVSGKPHLHDAQKKLQVPILINEYCWLWITRDGNPTCLTDKVYESLLGRNSTVEQRRRLRARYVAALTEFWRCHRECAGVLHFCSLGYSRPGDKPRPEGGATSDDWVDLRKLKYEPNFQEYVKEAFHPVGLMLDFWAEEIAAGATQQFKVYVINDRDVDWQGEVRLRLLQGKKSKVLQAQRCQVAALGREILNLSQAMPSEPGDYTLVAELKDGRKTIRSLRDFKVQGSKTVTRAR